MYENDSMRGGSLVSEPPRCHRRTPGTPIAVHPTPERTKTVSPARAAASGAARARRGRAISSTATPSPCRLPRLCSTSIHPVRLAYQPPASSTFLSEQTSHQQPANSAFLSEQISTSHQRTGSLLAAWPSSPAGIAIYQFKPTRRDLKPSMLDNLQFCEARQLRLVLPVQRCSDWFTWGLTNQATQHHHLIVHDERKKWNS
jgi:hypothetical protein